MSSLTSRLFLSEGFVEVLAELPKLRTVIPMDRDVGLLSLPSLSSIYSKMLKAMLMYEPLHYSFPSNLAFFFFLV